MGHCRLVLLKEVTDNNQDWPNCIYARIQADDNAILYRGIYSLSNVFSGASYEVRLRIYNRFHDTHTFHPRY